MKQLIRKIVCYSSQEVGVHLAMGGPKGEYQHWSGGKRERETVGKSIYGGLHRKQWVK